MDYFIKHHNRIDSTNGYAMELISTSPPEGGTVIWADEQTHGVGHGSNQWESESGKNLTFSLILKPEQINPGDQFMLTQMVSIALYNLITDLLNRKDIKIKWPNDIYIMNNKVAGILIRNILRGSRISYSVIGIGLNVNQEKFQSDAPNPISLIHFNETPLSIEDILSDLLIRISGIYSGLDSKEYREELNRQYLNNLYRYKQSGRFREGKREFTATLEGIGEYGKLKLKTEEGKVQLYDFKEVEFVD